MRTALLPAQHRMDDGTLRAGARLAGRSLLARQAELACGLGAERVIVIGAAPDAALAEAILVCQNAGVTFERAVRFASLAALLHAEHAVLLLAEGLLPDPALLGALLVNHRAAAPEWRKRVLCLPADDPQARAFPEDFERVDATRCWAGALVMRGAAAQALAEFPADANPVSLLLRLALQAGTPCHTLSPDERARKVWRLIPDRSAAAAHEAALVAAATRSSAASAPSEHLAALIARRLGLRALTYGEEAGLAGALALFAAALASAALGSGALGLGLGAAGWLAAMQSGAFARLASGLGVRPERRWIARLRDPGGDALAAIILALALSPAGLAVAALGPIAVAALRLAARAAPTPRLHALWCERPGHLALLALAAALGHPGEAAAALALAALLQALFTPAPRSFPE